MSPQTNLDALQAELLIFSAQGDSAGVARILSANALPPERCSPALSEAASTGHAQCVRLLIPASDPKAGDSEALVWAAMHGHAKCVELLIPVSDSKASDSRALILAAMNGHAQCVQLLIPTSTPLIQAPAALDEALNAGHANVLGVMLAHEPRLLERTDLTESLYAASAKGHSELECFLRSIIDQRSIVEHLDAPTALNAPAPRRL